MDSPKPGLSTESTLQMVTDARSYSNTEVKSASFGGTLANASLPDIIQLVCISRNTCRIVVKSRAQTGMIFVRTGEIVHAETGNLKGQEAFYAVISWELGTFRCDTEPPEQETIRENWNSLLIESMKRRETSVA